MGKRRAKLDVQSLAVDAAASVTKKKRETEAMGLRKSWHAVKFRMDKPIKRPEAKRAAARSKFSITKKVKYIRKKFLRENVNDRYFIMNNLKWTPWKLYSDSVSRKYTKVFKNEGTAAIYEVAVQPEGRSRRVIVMFWTTGGTPSGYRWDSFITRGKAIREQLNSVLLQGCKVVVRRANIPKVYTYGGLSYKGDQKVATLLKNTYHYAWMKTKGVNGRDIVRRGKTLSKVLL